MHSRFYEAYSPRIVTNHGVWNFDSMQIKVYGILAEDKAVTNAMLSKAQLFLDEDVLPIVTKTGESNELGFIIIHPGDLGLSISAHWWIQGSVLCQHIHRQLYEAEDEMDTLERPVVACVWELAIINAEQEAWRKTMMTLEPSHVSYLESRVNLTAV